MTIRVFVGEDKKGKKELMFEADNKTGPLSALSLGLVFGKDETILEALGQNKPKIIKDDYLDEKMEKELKDFEELVDVFYEKVYHNMK